MKLSVVIPARNEEGNIERTVLRLHETLAAAGIEHEIVVVNDGSTDGTGDILMRMSRANASVRRIDNGPPHGFGLAVRAGLEGFEGDAVAVYMADESDSPGDLVRFYRAMVEENVDCVFGSRFIEGGRVHDYPQHKFLLNRVANTFIKILFGLHYNDVTNAFKLYRRHVIAGLRPFLSPHFNLTVELPLKAIVRGYTYTVLPNEWTNRKYGESRLKIQEMGSRYLFIVLYCFIEKWLSRGDYRKP
jgi:dolichol-phosphate mannosyltransferase